MPFGVASNGKIYFFSMSSKTVGAVEVLQLKSLTIACADDVSQVRNDLGHVTKIILLFGVFV